MPTQTKKTVKSSKQVMASRLQDTLQRVKIRLSVLSAGQMHGEWDVVMDKKYTTTLKCIEEDSEAFVMNRPDFMRLFKTNEEAWKIMQ